MDAASGLFMDSDTMGTIMAFLGSLPIRKKLYVAFGGMFLLLAGIGALAVQQIGEIAGTGATIGSRLATMAAIGQVASAAERYRITQTLYLTPMDAATRASVP
jgi:hypothetical protein